MNGRVLYVVACGSPAARNNSHACSIARVTCDRLLDASTFLFYDAINQCNITLENFSGAKLISQVLMISFGLGNNQQTGSIFV